MNVAIVYDRVTKWGGAERVLLALHKLYPHAPLYTAVYNSKNARWANVFDVRPSFLNRLPFASSMHEVLPMLTPFAFESFSFDEFDLVISVTSAEAKGIITKPHTLHICYCLTPTRYLWSGYAHYIHQPGLGMLSGMGGRVLKKFAPLLQRWDIIAASRPDIFIAISNRVKQRIETFYKRRVDAVIYPPIEESIFFDLEKSPKTHMAGYFLTVSRLVSYKRIDILIKACNECKLQLVIIGSGKEEYALRKIAGNTITFVTNYLTEKELVSYYDNCRAFLYCSDEDFGIAAVEAQARGKAVIAYSQSGVSESVIDSKTGILFSSQSVESVRNALGVFEHTIIEPDDCKKQAEFYSTKRFIREIKNIVKEKQTKGTNSL